MKENVDQKKMVTPQAFELSSTTSKDVINIYIYIYLLNPLEQNNKNS
jgi:hypothetical protein